MNHNGMVSYKKDFDQVYPIEPPNGGLLKKGSEAGVTNNSEADNTSDHREPVSHSPM